MDKVFTDGLTVEHTKENMWMIKSKDLASIHILMAVLIKDSGSMENNMVRVYLSLLREHKGKELGKMVNG